MSQKDIFEAIEASQKLDQKIKLEISEDKNQSMKVSADELISVDDSVLIDHVPSVKKSKKIKKERKVDEDDELLGSTDVSVVTKSDLAEVISEHIGLNKRESKEMIEDFFQLMINALVNSENVKISGFGNFQLRDKVARPGRNPKTGEVVNVEARRVVTFHPSQKLKNTLSKNVS